MTEQQRVEVNIDDLFMVIGQQQVELVMLRKRLESVSRPVSNQDNNALVEPLRDGVA